MSNDDSEQTLDPTAWLQAPQIPESWPEELPSQLRAVISRLKEQAGEAREGDGE